MRDAAAFVADLRTERDDFAAGSQATFRDLSRLRLLAERLADESRLAQHASDDPAFEEVCQKLAALARELGNACRALLIVPQIARELAEMEARFSRVKVPAPSSS